jgi:hypothetical protein
MESYDPVSRKLAGVAPIADERLMEAVSRYEALTITELDTAWDAVNADLRVWVEDDANTGRPVPEFPAYIDRIAIDMLRERRTWME